MIHLTIDDRPIQVEAGRTLLEACREFGIPIPTLCYHPALEPYGGCRLCMVSAALPLRSSRLVAACVTPCEEGLVVQTRSEAAQRSRRLTAELLLASAWDNPEIQALARQFGVDRPRYRMPESDDCILCGLCVRACKEIVGVAAISLVERGVSKTASPPFHAISPTCIGCGTCVLICPTGAIRLSDIAGYRSRHTWIDGQEAEDCQACGDSFASQPISNRFTG